MKHPLTSKERRGLTAVAAAALLCILAGFIVRSFRPAPPPVQIIQQVKPDSAASSDKPDKSNKTKKTTKSEKTKKKKKKSKSEKTRSSRDYLDDRERLND